MLVGTTAVYFLMNLIGRPSLRYGIPFPVVARISFGVMGANLAAIVRGRGEDRLTWGADLLCIERRTGLGSHSAALSIGLSLIGASVGALVLSRPVRGGQRGRRLARGGVIRGAKLRPGASSGYVPGQQTKTRETP